MIITCEHFLLLFTFAATHSSSIKMNLVYQCNRKVDYVVHLESKEENYEYIMVECLSAICCLILLFFLFKMNCTNTIQGKEVVVVYHSKKNQIRLWNLNCFVPI